MIDVSICFANWNTTELMKGCIRKIEENPPKCSYEIIIVDNGSTDGYEPHLFNSYRHVINGRNLGFAIACNQGILISRGRYVCLMNTDVLPEPGFIDKMYEYLETHPDVGLVAPAATNVCSLDQGGAQGKIVETNSVIPFMCVMIPKKIILQLGLLALKYGEDIEYCQRLLNAGYKLVIVGTAFVHHLLSRSYINNKIRRDQYGAIAFARDVLEKRFFGEIE